LDHEEEGEERIDHLGVQDFAAWLDKQLLDKYALNFARLLGDMRPPLLLLKELRHHLEHIAALVTHPRHHHHTPHYATHEQSRLMLCVVLCASDDQFTYQPKRKTSGLHGGLAEGRSVLPYVENAIHVASTLPTLPSLAVDSVSLSSFHAQLQEVGETC
jgi:hypothetical protein